MGNPSSSIGNSPVNETMFMGPMATSVAAAPGLPAYGASLGGMIVASPTATLAMNQFSKGVTGGSPMPRMQENFVQTNLNKARDQLLSIVHEQDQIQRRIDDLKRQLNRMQAREIQVNSRSGASQNRNLPLNFSGLENKPKMQEMPRYVEAQIRYLTLNFSSLENKQKMLEYYCNYIAESAAASTVAVTIGVASAEVLNQNRPTAR